MGRIYPLPPEKEFAAHSFHEMGVLLDHFLHAQDRLNSHPIILEHFGDYLSASSFFRKDRAMGWKADIDRPNTYPLEIKPPKPLPAIANLIHGGLRSLALDFRVRLEKPKGYEELGKELADILKEYRKWISDNKNLDPDEHPEKLTLEQKQQFSCAEQITTLKEMLSPKNMPTVTFHWGNGDIRTDSFTASITIDNLKALHPNLSQSTPALAVFVAGYTGMAMVDRTKVPSAYRDFLKNVTNNEADITFILDALAARIIEANERKNRVNDSTSVFYVQQTGVTEGEKEKNLDLIRQHFSDKFDMPRILGVLQEHVTDLALNYHFYKITHESTEESLETIRRLVRFAKQDYTENFAVPVEITQPKQAGVLLYAIANKNDFSEPMKNALCESSRELISGKTLENYKLRLIQKALEHPRISKEHDMYVQTLQKHFGFDLEKIHER